MITVSLKNIRDSPDDDAKALETSQRLTDTFELIGSSPVNAFNVTPGTHCFQRKSAKTSGR